MKTIQLGSSDLQVSAIALGCMRMKELTVAEVEQVLATTTEQGINFFDHADIYGGGECERLFGEALECSGLDRSQLFLQSKCGIRQGYFDFSKEHIIRSVEGSLQRLKTDYLDVLALHRPDTLMEPEEVASAFYELEKAGKVRYFGVSNQKPYQIALLQQALQQPLIVNQLQFGVMHTGMIDQGLHVNMRDEASIDRDGSVLEYCRLRDITIQTWSPYQYGFFEGVFLNNEKFPEVNQVIDELAAQYQVSNTALATAWILRHPAQMQTIVGSMSPIRLTEIAQATEVRLTREEWYRVYRAAGNILP